MILKITETAGSQNFDTEGSHDFYTEGCHDFDTKCSKDYDTEGSDNIFFLKVLMIFETEGPMIF